MPKERLHRLSTNEPMGWPHDQIVQHDTDGMEDVRHDPKWMTRTGGIVVVRARHIHCRHREKNRKTKGGAPCFRSRPGRRVARFRTIISHARALLCPSSSSHSTRPFRHATWATPTSTGWSFGCDSQISYRHPSGRHARRPQPASSNPVAAKCTRRPSLTARADLRPRGGSLRLFRIGRPLLQLQWLRRDSEARPSGPGDGIKSDQMDLKLSFWKDLNRSIHDDL